MILAFVMLAVAATLGGLFYRAYRATPGSAWDRALAAAHGSATILWARLVAFISAAATSFAGFAEILGAPAVSDAIRAALTPEYVGPVMIAMALISEWARRRTLEH